MSTALIFYPGILLPVVSPVDDGVNPVSTTTSSSWTVQEQISPQVTSRWDIIAYGISAEISSDFNILHRIHKTGYFSYHGLCSPVVSPIDDKDFIPGSSWNIDTRISARSSSEWDIHQRRSSDRQAHWNIRIAGYAHQIADWDVLRRVYKPGVTMYEWVNQLCEPVSRPLQYENFSPDPSVQWHLDSRIHSYEKIQFDIRIPVKVRKSVAYNDLTLSVTDQVAVKWNLHEKISPVISSDWHLLSRRPAKKVISWHDNYSLDVVHPVKWNVTDNVSSLRSVKWNIDYHIQKRVKISWRDLEHIKLREQAAWNNLTRIHVKKWNLVYISPGNICSSVVRPIDVPEPALKPESAAGLCSPVTEPIDNSYYLPYGQASQPGIQWRVGINPSGRVTCQKSCEFNVYTGVSKKNAASWKTYSRNSTGIRSQFNIYIKVTNSSASSWNIGSWVSGHIRQTAQTRTDFAY